MVFGDDVGDGLKSVAVNALPETALRDLLVVIQDVTHQPLNAKRAHWKSKNTRATPVHREYVAVA